MIQRGKENNACHHWDGEGRTLGEGGLKVQVGKACSLGCFTYSSRDSILRGTHTFQMILYGKNVEITSMINFSSKPRP